MKKNNSLGKTLNFYSMLLFIISIMVVGCVKTPNIPTPIPPNPIPTQDAPVFTTLTANGIDVNPASSKIYVWEDDTVVINATGVNTTSFTVGENVFTNTTFTHQTPKLKTTTVYTVVAKGPTGLITTKEFTVVVYSQVRKFFCNYGSFKLLQVKICKKDSVNFPSAWVDKPSIVSTFCDLTRFYPDGTGDVTMGPCKPNAGTVFKLSVPWELRKNDTAYFDGLTEWHIDWINASGFQISYVDPLGYVVVYICGH